MSSESHDEQQPTTETGRWHPIDQAVFTIGRIENSESEIKQVESVLAEIRGAITPSDDNKSISGVSNALDALSERYAGSKFIKGLVEQAQDTLARETDYSQSFDRVAEMLVADVTGQVPLRRLAAARFTVSDMKLYQELGLLPDQDLLLKELTNPDEVAKRRFQKNAYETFTSRAETDEELQEKLELFGDASKSIAYDSFSKVLHLSPEDLAYAEFASILDATRSFSKKDITPTLSDQIAAFKERFTANSELIRILNQYTESAERYRQGEVPANLTQRSIEKVLGTFVLEGLELKNRATKFKLGVELQGTTPADIVSLYANDLSNMMIRLYVSRYAEEYDRQLMRIIDQNLLSQADQAKLLRLTEDLNAALLSNSTYHLVDDLRSEEPLKKSTLEELKKLRLYGLGSIREDSKYMGAITPDSLARLSRIEKKMAVRALLEDKNYDLALELIEESMEIEDDAEKFASSPFALEWDAFVNRHEDLHLGIPIERQTRYNISDSKKSSREYLEKLANHGIKYFMNEPTLTGRNLDVLSESMVLVRELSESDHPAITESDRERILEVQRSVWKWLNNDMDPRECLRLTIQYAWAESKVRQLNISYPAAKAA